MIEQQGHNLRILVETRLPQLLAAPGLPGGLAAALRSEPAETLALALTAGGPLACALLALDSRLDLSDGASLGYGALLALSLAALAGREILAVGFSTQPQLGFAAEPGGLHLALAAWPSGRARLAVGGFAAAPALALDGREASGLQTALENALSAAPDRLPTALELLATAAAEVRLQPG